MKTPGCKPVLPVGSKEELLAYALEIEKEAVERFSELGDQMELHNNHEVADLFRKLAVIEGKHVENVKTAARDQTLPALQSWEYEWEGGLSPEGGEGEAAHYLMEPWDAIQLALEGERRAAAFFEHVAASAADEELVKLASDHAAEEREHVALLEQWQERFPCPEKEEHSDWDDPVSQA